MQKKSLVIGINNYEHFSTLENCINDAEDMHAFLVKNGFESTLVLDPAQADLIHMIAQFKNSIGENTVSLIFFAGHALQEDNYNYLVTADSVVKISAEIRYNCLHVDELFIKNSKTNMHLVILDACRNNPFSDGRRGGSVGLSRMNAPAGTLIAFSTSPNSASLERSGERNGIYTNYLLKNMQAPNLPIELVFKNTRNDVIDDTRGRQVPWEESSLFGEHFSFIKIKEENIEDLATQLMMTEKNVLLPDLMPFFNSPTFNTASLEQLMLVLALLKISFSREEEGINPGTVDQDYFNDMMIDKFYPLFQERLINEDKATEPFTIEIFDGITIVKEVNFGYNWLDTPDESFPQMMMNFINFKGHDGILFFYLSVKDEQHLLKPGVITLEDGNIKFYNYAIITGNKVKEIVDHYIKIRAPYEKKVPDWESTMTIEDIDEDEFERLFKGKK